MQPVGRVGVLLGGTSSERDVSIRSGKAVAQALRGLGYDVVEIGEQGDIHDTLLRSLIDVAFVALHGRYGEDGQVQTLLESLRIPYTGSGPDASSLAFDKVRTKDICRASGLSIPEYEVVRRSDRANGFSTRLPYPVAVKPACEGSSIGFARVDGPDGLEAAVRAALELDETVLVERFISGTEVTAGVVCEQPVPLVEVVPKGGSYDYEHKYTPGMTQYLVPARLPAEVTLRIQQMALQVHKTLGCRDLSRTDFIVTPAGVPYMLEINAIPGFTSTSLLPKAASAAGMDFATLCERILLAAWGRREPGGAR